MSIEPNSPTTVPATAEIVIIGGGIIGICVANSLAQRGVSDVVVVEKDHLASGSTGRSAGVIETQYLSSLDIEMRVKSKTIFDQIFANTAAEFHPIGYLRLMFDATQRSAFERSVELQHQFGVDSARFLSPEDVKNLIPDFQTDDILGALYGPEDGYADPYSVTQVLSENARQMGVQIVSNTEVTDTNCTSGKVEAVETTQGSIECDVVVNAAGPWAVDVAEQCNLEVPVKPVRRQLIVGHAPPEYTSRDPIPRVMEYLPNTAEPGLYVRGEGRDQLLLGIHTEDATAESAVDPDCYSKTYDREFVIQVSELLGQRAPDLDDFKLINGWAGLYSNTPDSNPIIDTHPCIENYYIATGFSGKGFQIGPVVGKLVSELILETSFQTVDPGGAFSLSRF